MRMELPSRTQRMLLPPSIDEFVGPDHPVRVVVEVVERLRVAKLLEEAARVDDAEDSMESETPELGSARERVAAIEAPLEEMNAAGVSERNSTDPDARIQSLKDGRRPGYNAQLAASGEDGLILAGDVTAHGDDTNQLLPLREQVIENTGEQPGTIVADAG